jgi:hypothetical protein
MRDLLQELRRTFKFIVIDSPPVTVVNDAAVLSSISDGVLFVIDGQKTSKPSASRALVRLEALRSPLLGVILNRVNLDDPHYSYYKTHSSYYDTDPDIDSSLNGRNGNGAEKLAYKFKSISRLVQMWSRQGSQQERHSSVSMEVNPNVAANRASNLQGTATPERVAEENRQTFSETVARGETVVLQNESRESRATTEFLPQESLDRLIAAVTKSIGPIASQVVREQMAVLGESCDAFPKNRVGELVKLLQHEISQRNRSSQF